MRGEHARFVDRREAGERLLERLRHEPLTNPVVLAIPRGGVEVGAVIAGGLGCELDVVLSRKLRSPVQPELAIGAVSESGVVHLSAPASGTWSGVSESYLEAERRRQLDEIDRRRTLIRGVRPRVEVEGRTVILTDDGIATGSTMIAAVRTVRSERAAEVIVAVPVAPPEKLDAIRELCDRLICLEAPLDFHAVGQFYDTFDEVTDDRVLALLGASLAHHLAPISP